MTFMVKDLISKNNMENEGGNASPISGLHVHPQEEAHPLTGAHMQILHKLAYTRKGQKERF